MALVLRGDEEDGDEEDGEEEEEEEEEAGVLMRLNFERAAGATATGVVVRAVEGGGIPVRNRT
jgi:hypothetical protein